MGTDRQTDTEITVNRPDVTVKNMKETINILTNVAIPAVRNVTQKEAERKLK
jgi:hypothetical protein